CPRRTAPAPAVTSRRRRGPHRTGPGMALLAPARVRERQLCCHSRPESATSIF
ncbi:MAG: hypothetical protein AVDCRST_MAG29-1050, partial [uncultured Nocardioidaceae bacterium]